MLLRVTQFDLNMSLVEEHERDDSKGIINMNQGINQVVCGVIKHYLQAIVSKKGNHKSVKGDLLTLVQRYGPHAEEFMFVCLMTGLDFTRKDQSSAKTAFLLTLLNDFSNKDHFLHYFGRVILATCEKGDYFEYVVNFSKLIKIGLPVQVLVGLAMVLSADATLSHDGDYFLIKKLSEHLQQGKTFQFPARAVQELFALRQRQEYASLDLEFKFIMENNPFDSPLQRVEEVFFRDKFKMNSQFICSLGTPDFSAQVLEPPPTLLKHEMLRELGPPLFSSPEYPRLVFGDQHFTEEQVLNCLIVLAQQEVEPSPIDPLTVKYYVAALRDNYQEQAEVLAEAAPGKRQSFESWNHDKFFSFCGQRCPGLNWTNVLKRLDRADPGLKSAEVFVALMRLVSKAKRTSVFSLDTNFLMGRWRYPLAQVQVIQKYIRGGEPGLLDISLSGQPKSAAEQLPAVKNQLIGFPSLLFAYTQFCSCLLQLSESEAYSKVSELFKEQLVLIPDVLLLTLSSIQDESTCPLQTQLLSVLLPKVLVDFGGNIRILELLWENNQHLVVSAVCELYKAEHGKDGCSFPLSKVLNIAQVLPDSLRILANCEDEEFGVALGILAGKKQYLHFQKWIKERLKIAPNAYIQALLNYTEEHVFRCIRADRSKAAVDQLLEKANLSRQLIAIIFEGVLQVKPSRLSKRVTQKMKVLYKRMCEVFPELAETPLTDEIEGRANKFFQSLYREETNLQQAIKEMSRLKGSGNQEQKQLFAGMITLLYSEMRFYLSYPAKELQLTARIFAMIINHDLIDQKLVDVFLQFIRDSLREDNAKHEFASIVLTEILPKLLTNRQFIQEIVNLELLIKRSPLLVQNILAKARESGFTPELGKGSLQLLDSACAPTPVPEPEEKEQVDYDILVQLDKTNKYQIPSTIKDRYMNYFIEAENGMLQGYNGLYSLEGDTCHWLSHITFFRKVVKAISEKQVQLISEIVEKAKNKNFERTIMRIAYRVLKKYLQLTRRSQNDRNLKQFKNAGTFLGRLTLARNRPVLITQLNLKQALVQSLTNKHRCQFNLQVISKILEHAKFTVVFKEKSPWMAPILTILKENETKVTSPAAKNDVQAVLRDLLAKGSPAPDPSEVVGEEQERKQSLAVLDMPSYVKINQEQLGQFLNKGLDLKKIVAHAVQAAIQEIIPPVIARSVTIALVTTKELTIKDFAMEPDEKKFLKGAQHMIQNLAGALALVTCREPLRVNMSNHLKKMLQDQNVLALTEQQKNKIISSTSYENLNLGCALIRQAVIEKATDDISIEQNVKEAVEKRKVARAEGRQYCDEAYLQVLTENLPERLRPNGPILPEQFKIYEDFGKKARSEADQLHRETSPDSLLLKTLQNLIWNVLESEGDRLPALIDQLKEVKHRPAAAIKDFFIQKDLRIVKSVEVYATLLVSLVVKDLMPLHMLTQVLVHYLRSGVPASQPLALKVVKQLQSHSPQDYHLDRFEQLLGQLKRSNQYIKQNDPEVQRQIGNFQKQSGLAQQFTFKKLVQWMGLGTESQANQFLSQLETTLAARGDQCAKQFFQMILQKSVEKSLAGQNLEVLDYTYLDSACKLIMMFAKSSSRREEFFQIVCEAICRVLFQQHQGAAAFNARPFFKIIYNLLFQLQLQDYGFQEASIIAFTGSVSKMLHKLQPMHVPGFAFGWLALVSNNYFMPLLLNKHECWEQYSQLVIDLLTFFRVKVTPETYDLPGVACLYRGTLRTFVLLLKEYPNFLTEFSYLFEDSIGDNYVQLRNIVLSAFSKSLKFTDIFSYTELKQTYVNNLGCMPKYYRNFFQAPFEEQPAKTNFIFALRGESAPLLAQIEASLKFGRSLLHAFVVLLPYSQFQQALGGETVLQQSKIDEIEGRCFRLLFEMIRGGSKQFRENLVELIVNEIKYPNLITLFYTQLAIRLLLEEDDLRMSLPLHRSITERVRIEKPQPWGLLFVNGLIKKSKKSFQS